MLESAHWVNGLKEKMNLTFDYNSGRYRFIPTGGSNGAVGSLDPPLVQYFSISCSFLRKKLNLGSLTDAVRDGTVASKS